MLQLLIVLFLLSLPFLYDASPTLRYYARFYVYYGYVMVAAVLLLPVMACRTKDVSNLIIASKICRVLSRILGLDWTIRGADNLSTSSTCILVANHQSSLDILGMFEVWELMGRVTVVAKRELLLAGPFGLAAWLCDLIFIDRTDPTSAREVMNKTFHTMLSKKNKIWVFPEGTRRNTGTIHPFKKGAFHMAVSAQIPIIPVVFSHYYFLDSHIKNFEPGKIIMTILPPIKTQGLKEVDVEALATGTRSLMLETFLLCQRTLTPTVIKS